MQAYIYQDEGVSEKCVQSLLTNIPKYLQIKAQIISANEILAGSLKPNCLFVMPGGADLPYCAKLNGKGNDLIKAMVANGGFYLGICAGAYYGCSEIDFLGDNYSICGARELTFFTGKAVGSLADLTNQKYFDETSKTKSMVLIQFANGVKEYLYYHGGCAFQTCNKNFEPLAFYPNKQLAMVAGNFGSGKYLLSGVHFELDGEIYQQMIFKQSLDKKTLEFENQILQFLNEDYVKQAWQIIKNQLTKK